MIKNFAAGFLGSASMVANARMIDRRFSSPNRVTARLTSATGMRGEYRDELTVLMALAAMLGDEKIS